MPEPTASVERLNEFIEDSQSDDNSSVTDDDADVALLGAEIARHPARTWGQVKDIVIEVSLAFDEEVLTTLTVLLSRPYRHFSLRLSVYCLLESFWTMFR